MATQNRRKLRIGRVKDGLLFPFKNILALLRLGLFPTLIAGVLSCAIVTGYPVETVDLQDDAAAERFVSSLLPLFIVISLLFTIAMSIYAVGIHRLIIRGEPADWVVLRFGRYELAYLGVLLLFYAASVAEESVLEFIGQQALGGTGFPGRPGPAGLDASVLGVVGQPVTMVLLSLALIGVLIWVHLRLALMFPHAAVEGSIAPLISWHAMAGNSLRLLGALILLCLAGLVLWIVLGSTALVALVGLLPTEGARSSGEVLKTMSLIGLAIAPVIAILLAVPIAVMSYVYKDLVEDSLQDAQPGIGNQPALG